MSTIDISPIRYLDPDTVVSMVRDIVAPRIATASGYGSRLPTAYRIKLSDNRWRRVYVMCYGNAGTPYVIVNRRDTLLDIDTEYALSSGVPCDRWTL